LEPELKYDLISFDLQGTLSDSAFSDEFWLELLPQLYAEKYQLTLAESKAKLKTQFVTIGKYDRLYYCPQDWLHELTPEQSFTEVIKRLSHPPHLFEDCMELVHRLSGALPLIIVSTTTYDFIDVELGGEGKYFNSVFSTIDDFDTAGKKPEIFKTIAKQYGLSSEKMLHIGDCSEMDIANAQAAGWDTFFFDKKRQRSALLDELTAQIGTL
jgi:HAD superfamily hydrolase (TIGR01549 family)